MIVVTVDFISGRELEIIDFVCGSTIQTKNVFKDIGQGLKTLIGGELGSYTKMMNEAREIALSRMKDAAAALGADAVIGARIASSEVMQGAAEVMAYGTAVKFK